MYNVFNSISTDPIVFTAYGDFSLYLGGTFDGATVTLSWVDKEGNEHTCVDGEFTDVANQPVNNKGPMKFKLSASGYGFVSSITAQITSNDLIIPE